VVTLRNILCMNLGFILLLSMACAPTQEQEKENRDPGQLTIEVGQQSLVLDNCLFRTTEKPRSAQLVGTNADGSMFFLEIKENQGNPSAGMSFEAGLFVLKLAVPVQSGEDRVYQNHSYRLTSEYRGMELRLTTLDDRAKGRVSGQCEDLANGRSHEVRGKFDCIVEAP